MNRLYRALIDKINEKSHTTFSSSLEINSDFSEKVHIIPPNRTRYLSEITENNRNYDKWVKEQKEIAQQLYSLRKSIAVIKEKDSKDHEALMNKLEAIYSNVLLDLDPKNKKILDEWQQK